MHVIDGMSFIHSVPNAILKGFETFKDFADYQVIKIENILQNNETKRVDLVYDRYSDINKSLKNIESCFRGQGKSPLNVKITNNTTKIPKQWSRYLASSDNKRSLVNYVGNYIINNTTVPEGKVLYISGCFENESFKRMTVSL